VNVLGVLENMAGFSHPLKTSKFLDPVSGADVTAATLATLSEKCPEVLALMANADVFPRYGGGPEAMAAAMGVPFSGSVPMDPNLTAATEAGVSFVDTHPDSPAAKPFLAAVDSVLSNLKVVEASGGAAEL
jgi:hypothetical protein